MKFIFVLFLGFSLINCSQKPVVGPQKPEISTSKLAQDFSFLKECSQVRAVNPTLWLLTCQRHPHPDRTEVYEWSADSGKFGRLTFQDGQIWDLAPIDENHFYYSSSYDEFKEQFASIISGAKTGSDIYLKNRKQTDFSRLTNMKGLEISFFYHSPTQLLYYIHESEGESRILTLNKKNQTQTLYTAKGKILRHPVWMEHSKTLYWVEYESPIQGPVVKSLKAKKISEVFKSDSKIFHFALAPKSEQLLIGFATGVGVEIWNLNLTDACWKLAYRIPEPVSEFYIMSEKTIFLTIKGSLKQDSILEPGEVCHPSPPGLGVSI